MKRLLFVFLLIIFISSKAFATNYYVDATSGDDDNTGLSDAQAWATLSKVNSTSFSAGDDIYLKCGSTFNPTVPLDIDWSGTIGDQVVIGAYYGSGTIGVSGNKPIIDGQETYPSSYTYCAAHSSECWNGLVRVTYEDYVTIQNLDVRNVGGDGIEIVGAIGNRSIGCRILNCDVSNTWRSGVQLYVTDGGLVQESDISGAAYCRTEFGDGPAAVSISNGLNDVIRQNKVHENRREGIGPYTNSSGTLIEWNEVWSNDGGIYLHSTSDAVIRYNLVYNPGSPPSYASDSRGISVNHESQYSPGNYENIEIYGNWLAGLPSSAIAIGCNNVDSTYDDILIQNNTLIDNITQFNKSAGARVTNVVVVNNIEYCPTGGCTVWNNYTSNVTFNNNAWESTGDWSGSGDVVTGNNFSVTSGWRSLTAQAVNISDFAPTSSSNVLGAGDNTVSKIYFARSDATEPTDAPPLYGLDVYGFDLGATIFLAGGPETPDPDTTMTQIFHQTEGVSVFSNSGSNYVFSQ